MNRFALVQAWKERWPLINEDHAQFAQDSSTILELTDDELAIVSGGFIGRGYGGWDYDRYRGGYAYGGWSHRGYGNWGYHNGWHNGYGGWHSGYGGWRGGRDDCY